MMRPIFIDLGPFERLATPALDLLAEVERLTESLRQAHEVIDGWAAAHTGLQNDNERLRAIESAVMRYLRAPAASYDVVEAYHDLCVVCQMDAPKNDANHRTGVGVVVSKRDAP